MNKKQSLFGVTVIDSHDDFFIKFVNGINQIQKKNLKLGFDNRKTFDLKFFDESEEFRCMLKALSYKLTSFTFTPDQIDRIVFDIFRINSKTVPFTLQANSLMLFGYGDGLTLKAGEKKFDLSEN